MSVSKFQPSHQGKHPTDADRPGFVSNDRTRLGEHTRTNGFTGGKQPKPKAHSATGIHNGMSEQARMKAGAGGIGKPISAAPDASSSNPLDKTVPGKALAPVQASFGQRSRNGEVGPQRPGQAHATRKAFDPRLGDVLLASAVRNR